MDTPGLERETFYVPAEFTPPSAPDRSAGFDLDSHDVFFLCVPHFFCFTQANVLLIYRGIHNHRESVLTGGGKSVEVVRPVELFS